MGLFDHGYVVGAISNGEGDFIEVFADEFDDGGLLAGEETAADDRFAESGEVGE